MKNVNALVAVYKSVNLFYIFYVYVIISFLYKKSAGSPKN